MTDTIRQFDERSMMRIARAVRKIEKLPPHRPKQGTSRQQTLTGVHRPYLCLASEDIEHNTIGTVARATGTDFDSNLVATDEEIEVYNAGDKVWNGARVTIEPWTLQGAESSRFVIRHAWSATRIRGTTAATIAAGLSGTINSVVPLNGHFSPTTATVYLPTVNHAIGNNLMVWAEIVYRDADATSRWEIYQADCPP